MSKPTRRAALLSATAVATSAAVPAVAAASGSPVTPERIRQLADACHAANLAECRVIETLRLVDPTGVPAYDAARARTQAAWEAFDALAEAVWNSPIRAWDDVLARAEIARRWQDPDDDGHIDFDLANLDDPEIALVELLSAVLTLGGRNV